MTDEKKPLTERDRALRKRQWLVLYLPMILGLILVLALVIVIAVQGFREQNLGQDPASAWGDAAAIIVIIQAMLVSLIPLVLFVALCALFIWLYIKLRPVLQRGQEITEMVYEKTEETTGRLADTLTSPYSFGARVSAFFRFFRRSNV